MQGWYPGQYLCDVCLRVISVHGLNLLIHSRAVSTKGWYLFKGGTCSRVVSVQGWYLFKGGTCSRVVSIQGWYLSICSWLIIKAVLYLRVCQGEDRLQNLFLLELKFF